MITYLEKKPDELFWQKGFKNNKERNVSDKSVSETVSQLTNLSHEIHTPLNGILGVAQLMLNSEEITPVIKDDVEMIVESGNALLSLIDDILKLLQIESGSMKINCEPLQLNSILDNIHANILISNQYLEKKSKLQNVELRRYKYTEDILTLSDAEILQEVIFKLLENALKFTNQGVIEFGYTIVKKEIVFFVKDTGIGIPEDKTKKIFNRFIQVDDSPSREYKGAGLGLTIAKGLIKLLNGKIWCESNIGKGSCFYFTIPYKLVPTQTDFKELKVKN
jgi:signal transduction histidine kinase